MDTFQTPKGTYDILPEDWPCWHLVLTTAEAVMRRYTRCGVASARGA